MTVAAKRKYNKPLNFDPDLGLSLYRPTPGSPKYRLDSTDLFTGQRHQPTASDRRWVLCGCARGATTEQSEVIIGNALTDGLALASVQNVGALLRGLVNQGCAGSVGCPARPTRWTTLPTSHLPAREAKTSPSSPSVTGPPQTPWCALYAIANYLPDAQSDAILLLADGKTSGEVWAELAKDYELTAGAIEPNDIDTALDKPDTRSGFVVTTNDAELVELLFGDFEAWRTLRGRLRNEAARSADRHNARMQGPGVRSPRRSRGQRRQPPAARGYYPGHRGRGAACPGRAPGALPPLRGLHPGPATNLSSRHLAARAPFSREHPDLASRESLVDASHSTSHSPERLRRSATGQARFDRRRQHG